MSLKIGSKSIGENVIFSLIGASIVLISGFAISVIIARFLGPNEFGLYSLILWFRLTATIFLDIGFSNAITKYWAELDGRGLREQANKLFVTLLTIQFFLVVLYGVLIGFFSKNIASILGNEDLVPYLPIVALSLTLGIINGFLRSTLSGLQLFRKKSYVDIITSISNLLVVIIVLKSNLGIIGLLWMEVVLTAFQVLVFSRFVLPRMGGWKHTVLPKKFRKEVAEYCLGIFIFTSLNAIVTQRSETYFLARYQGTEEIAFFSLAYNIAMTAMNLVPATMGSVIMPALANRFGAGDRKNMNLIYSITIKYVLLFTLPFCIGGIVLSTQIIALLYGPAYAMTSSVLKILLPGAVFGSLITPLLALFWALGKPNIAILWMLFSSFFSILLAYILVPRFGVYGAAISNSINQIVNITIGILYLSRSQGFKPPLRSISRIALSTLPLGIILIIFAHFFNTGITLVISVLVGLFIYTPALFVFKALKTTDLDLLEETSSIAPPSLAIFIKRVIGKVRKYVT
jgi:stage V sporulation protein B